ncbi:hypothetical protein ACQP2F_32820 [Actinoplanes sp. CA-030573]|uniref:hypothetical protein n=1 Tax=Actinoplanes sp. CA-030573 TaxID=3239898 RepID=UPI003D94D0E6
MPTDTATRIRLYRDYTGASHQAALDAVRSATHGIPPANTPEQAVLEAQLLAEFGRLGGEYWAHPLGISRVWHRPTGLAIWLDSHTILSSGEHHPASAAIVDGILPYWDPDSEVFGIPGLRVAGHRGALHLRSLCGRGAAVTLYGIQGTPWRQILRDRSAALVESGAVPLWNEPKLTPSEIDHLKQFPDVGANRKDIAWFGSGLLRRINLLYTHIDAYSAHAWVTEDRWSVEFSSSQTPQLGHDHFTTMLSDTSFGLPLQVAHRYCSCLTSQRYPAASCRIEMRIPDLTGSVDLRFQHWASEQTRERRGLLHQ